MPTLAPMLATLGDELPVTDGWLFEPKYDGMRVLAYVSADAVRLVTRNGKEKTAQFPELVAALGALAKRTRTTLVLDAEVVALDAAGEPTGFQQLQGRMHLVDADAIPHAVHAAPAALVAFDLLAQGEETLTALPLRERRRRLERLLPRATAAGADTAPPLLRASDALEDGRVMLERARAGGWEGIIAKRLDGKYRAGARASDWLKLKLQHRAEFVVGGFTEPRRTRPHLGALLLGYYDDAGALVYVGHAGGGPTHAELRAMRARLEKLARTTSPFATPPRSSEPAHWVRPQVVVEVKFAEWTADGRLRQPIILGIRDDKAARDVRRERTSLQPSPALRRALAPVRRAAAKEAPARAGVTKTTTKTATKTAKTAKTTAKTAKTAAKRGARGGAGSDVVAQLQSIEDGSGTGELALGAGHSLHVSSLDKRYFPDDGVTKGDLMRYYATVAPALLPHLADRPLALKRFPDGITGHSFFQQKAPTDPPAGVRTAEIATEEDDAAPRFVGGDLATLLYMVQLGTIAVHPWLSRLRTIDAADHAVIDLDPGPEVPFGQVVEVARLVKRALDTAGLVAALKTSGSRGLHIALPLPPRTSYERATRLTEVLAEVIVETHPDLATLERSIKARPKGTIYMDVQQNARGKSVVAPYAVRARAGATVSAPLRWTELRSTLTLDRFTVHTMPARLARYGDLWGEAMRTRNGARAIDALIRSAARATRPGARRGRAV